MRDLQLSNESENSWLHDLARAEVHPEAERLLGLASNQPEQLIEESTIRLLMNIRERLVESARIFNSFSDNGARFSEVKVYNVAQTPADFMLFRNQMKLVFSNTAPGVVLIAWSTHRNGLGMDSTQTDLANAENMACEILAQQGPFREIYWTSQGEKVASESVAKFYFAEFTRASREQRANKAQNQVLIDQIRSLLKDQGLDF